MTMHSKMKCPWIQHASFTHCQEWGVKDAHTCSLAWHCHTKKYDSGKMAVSTLER